VGRWWAEGIKDVTRSAAARPRRLVGCDHTCFSGLCRSYLPLFHVPHDTAMRTGPGNGVRRHGRGRAARTTGARDLVRQVPGEAYLKFVRGRSPRLLVGQLPMGDSPARDLGEDRRDVAVAQRLRPGDDQVGVGGPEGWSGCARRPRNVVGVHEPDVALAGGGQQGSVLADALRVRVVAGEVLHEP
jgi:hypothetical protein